MSVLSSIAETHDQQQRHQSWCFLARWKQIGRKPCLEQALGVFCEFVRLKLTMTKSVTYGPWPAIATPLRARKAQSNLRNIVKKGTKKFDDRS